MTEETKRRLRERFEQLLNETDQRPQYTIDELESLLLHIRDQTTEAAREEVNRELTQQEQGPEEEQEPQGEESPNSCHAQLAPACKIPGKIPCPHCGKANAWYKGQRARQVVTLAGILLLRRAYYYCRRCKSGVCPQDTERHLPTDTDFSHRVQQEVSYLCACLPFEHAMKTLARLCRVVVSAASAERVCRQQGHTLTQRFVAEREDQCLPLAFELEPSPQPSQKLATLPQPHTPHTLYLAADGIQTPMRGGSWREMKVGVVQSRLPDGRVEQDSQYVSFLGESEAFGAKWEALAISCGSLRAKRVVVLGDGAAWLWNIAQKRFPRAIQILDFWHALEYVGKVAREAFGESTEAGRQWLSARASEMKKSDWSSLHAALEAVRAQASESVVASVSDAVRYFRNNASRMDYARYLRMGLSIGSGIAESSCKRLVTERLKGSGMHWSAEGAQAVCSLRCLLLGGQWEEFLAFWNRQKALPSPLA